MWQFYLHIIRESDRNLAAEVVWTSSTVYLQFSKCRNYKFSVNFSGKSSLQLLLYHLIFESYNQTQVYKIWKSDIILALPYMSASDPRHSIAISDGKHFPLYYIYTFKKNAVKHKLI